MEEPFAMFVGPGFVDILARVDADSVEVPFRVVGPSGNASIEVYEPEGTVAWTYPARELLDVLGRAIGRLPQVMPD
jgi:hypothetical protein